MTNKERQELLDMSWDEFLKTCPNIPEKDESHYRNKYLHRDNIPLQTIGEVFLASIDL